jgi:hypothetical protein
VKQIVARALTALLIVVFVLYATDWAVWRTRVASGSGMGIVSVGVMIGTPLKGDKEEYDWAGVQAVECSRSLFPHAADYACWWLARQKTIEEK